MFISILIILVSKGIVLLELSAIILGLSQGMFYPTMNATILEKISERALIGRAMGLYIGSFYIGTTLAPFLLGFIAHRYGYQMMFIIVGLFTIMAFSVFIKKA